MSDDILLVEKCDAGYAVLTLNRPQALNAWSKELLKRFSQTLGELQDDPAVRVLIVTGAGRAFCAGLDVKELRADPQALFAQMRAYHPAAALEAFSGPVIAAINGDAVTGGFEISLVCDMRIVSQAARFADTHTRIGLLPGWGISQRLSRLVGIAKAKEIALTAMFVTAEQAASIGLANRVVPPDQLMAEARRLACDMLGGVPEVLAAYRALIDDGYALSLRDGLQLERERVEAWNRKVTAFIDGKPARRLPV
jgi:enoyl-CoA hydratase